MDQFIFQSKWSDEESQLPPLVEEVVSYDFKQPLHQGIDIQIQNQSYTFLIDLTRIGYEGTADIVCTNDKTIGDLKQMIYDKYNPAILIPDLWGINAEKEYKNFVLLKEIKVEHYTKLWAKKYQSQISTQLFKEVQITINYPQRNKKQNVTINTGTLVRDLYLKILHSILKDDDKKNNLILTYKGQRLNYNENFQSQGIEQDFQIEMKFETCGGCFPSFAPVNLSDGSTKQIKDIQIGEKVLSYDIDCQQFVSSQIIATHKTQINQLIIISTIQNNIITTSNHPFLTQEGWKAVQPHPFFKIKNLTIKDKILNDQNQFIQILSIQVQDFEEEQFVYNITTIRPNNYIAFGFVVHNMNKIQISINGTIKDIEILPDMLIYNLKVLIQMKYGIDVQKQKLMIKGIQLDDSKSIMDCFERDSKMIETIDVITEETTLLTERKNCLEFTIAIKQKDLTNLQKLEECFGLEKQNIPQIQPFIRNMVGNIKNSPQKLEQFQQLSIDQIVAIKLWTSNLVYKKINIDLRNNKYDQWKIYLKCLMEALRLCKYYNGQTFRGLRDYQNTQIYQLGKTLQASEISCSSKSFQIAQSFSNNYGMILQYDQSSSKDIDQLSLFPQEQEVVLLPFSQFVVTYISQKSNEPIYVTLKELPLPRWFRVLIWVDDKPQNNYHYAQELEKKYADISVVFCISTEEAIEIIEKNKWMVFLNKKNFRIVTDMARVENWILNENAGAEFIQYMYEVAQYKNEILVFCSNPKKAKQICKNKKLVGDYIISNQVKDLMKFIQFQ